MDTKKGGARGKKREDAVIRATGPIHEGEAKEKGMLRGLTFQFHLLMLYAIRAFNLGYENFRLATEVKDAEKFDDIIFSYPKENQSEDSGRCFHFLQLRYRGTTTNTDIKASHLINDRYRRFCLSAYFDSYRKIKRNPKMIGVKDEIKSLIICSNAKLKFDRKYRNSALDKSIFELSDANQFLSNKLLKFNTDFVKSIGGKKLVLSIKNSCISIPARFARIVMKDKKLFHEKQTYKSIETGLINSYLLVLCFEVVDRHSKRFRSDFIDGSNLTVMAEHFRDELWLQYLNYRGIKGPKDEKNFKCFLKDRVIGVSLQRGFRMEITQVQPKLWAKLFLDALRENKNTKVVKFHLFHGTMYKEIIDHLLDFMLIPLDTTPMFTETCKLVFYRRFLHDGWLPKDLHTLREHLKDGMRTIGMEFKELEDYTIVMDEYCPLDFSSRYCGERLEQDVQEFLEKLNLAFNQPGIEETEELIKQEMTNCVDGTDHRNAYAKFFSGIYTWAENVQGRYLTHGDISEFLQSESVSINLSNGFLNSTRLFREILKKESDSLKEDDGDLLRSMLIYGEVLLREDKLEKSLDIFNEILDRGRSIVEEDSLLLYNAKFYILLALRQLSRDEESKKLIGDMESNLMKIVDRYEACRGEDRVESGVLEAVEDSELNNGSVRLKGRVELDVDQVANAYKILGYLSAWEGRYEEAKGHYENSQKLEMESNGHEDDNEDDLVVKLIQELLQ